MPSDASMNLMNKAHRFILRVSGGRIGWKAAGMPVLELTTKGRKTGEPRVAMLTSPIREGAGYVVVASRGGDDKHPAWFLNLRDEPHVEVVIEGGPRTAALARVATPAERARLWPLITKDFANYAGYQRKTEREIPLVIIEPIAG